MATQPTVVVGVGRAGVNILSRIATLAEERGDQDKLDYIAMDTEPGTLNAAPDSATEIRLAPGDAFIQEDRSNFPYLTQSMDITNQGALRQRPVGRYNLDNNGPNGYSTAFRTLQERIETHQQNNEIDLTDDSSSFNVYFVHSLGGGTGSGTFPLLTGMLYKITNQLEDEYKADMYLAGVGVLPRLRFDPDVIEDPPGRSMYYPNAYAALNDLYVLTSDKQEIDDDDLEIFVHSNRFSLTDSEDRPEDESKIEFDEDDRPFDDYWLAGVREDRLERGKIQADRPETYRRRINTEIADGLLAISSIEESGENWAEDKPRVGVIGQGELRVPHEDVLQFCELKRERENKRERKNEEIPDEIEQKRTRQDEIRARKNALDPESVDDEELSKSVEGRVEGELISGANMRETASTDDIDRLFDTIEEDFGFEGLIIATHEAEEILNDERGAPQAREDWKKTVERLWSIHNLQSRPEFGGKAVTTLPGKAGGLEDFFVSKIDEYRTEKEEYDPGVVGKIQGAFPPVITPLENKAERAERIIERLQDRYDELERVIGQWERVQEMRRTIDDRRQDIRELIDSQLQRLEEEITDLQNEQDELARKIRNLDADINAKRQELVTQSTGTRLSVLPLREEKVDELSKEFVEETLTDLQSYVDEGYISEDIVSKGVEQAIGSSKTWGQSQDPVIELDASYRGEVMAAGVEADGTATGNPFTERWSLFAEENQEVRDSASTSTTASTNKASGSGLGHLDDPYKLVYVSFNRRDPVSLLEIFNRLRRMYEKGTFKRWAGQYDDHRQAFAYLEWYDQEIRNAYDITGRLEVPKPPEMERTRIEHPDVERDDMGNYITTNGLDVYLWKGNMWDRYNPPETNDYTGWDECLPDKGLNFKDLQRATASKDVKSQWLADQADWEDVLEEYRQNLIEETGVKLEFTE